MNIKEIKNEIIKFGKTLARVQFESEVIKLQEDEVKISDKAIGSKVEQVMTDGSLEALADGRYDLNGFVFEVKDGVITSIDGQEEIKEDEAKVETEMEAEVITEEAPAENPLEKEIADLKSELDALKEEIKAIKEAKNDDAVVAEEMKSEFSKLNETLEKFAKIPAEETKTNNNPNVGKAKEDKFKKLSGMFAK